jgi:putative peptidoglycan lipid II flippase
MPLVARYNKQMSEIPPSSSPSEAASAPINPAKSSAPGLLKAAGLIAAVTILSKLLGMLRDIGIAGIYGASNVSDAYFAAFQIPSFAIVLLGGLGGPFHTATVAVFSRLLSKDDEGAVPTEKAQKLASTLITITGLIFIGLSILVAVFAEPLMAGVQHGADPLKITLAANQLRIMSPILLIGGVVGIFYGLLNLYHVFFWPSLSPAGLSLFILAALFLFPSFDTTGQVLAWATLGGAVLQWIMQWPDFRRIGFKFQPNLDWRTPEVTQWALILLPALVSTTIGQLNVYVDMFFTSYLPVGGWTAVILGNRLIQFPIGVLQTALLVPIFPRFSRAAASGDTDAIRRDFRVGVVSLWMISIPMLVVLLLDTEAIIRLIFQHGRFDAAGTHMVSQAMIGLAFQMLPYFARDSITRVFFAYQDSRTPLVVGLIAIGFNAFFDWLFAGPLGLGVMGITLSTTAVTILNMTLLAILSRKHINNLGFSQMVVPFLKLLLSGASMAATMFVTQPFITDCVAHLPLQPLWSTYIALFISACLGVSVYGLLTLLLKLSEAEYLRTRVQGLLKRKSSS